MLTRQRLDPFQPTGDWRADGQRLNKWISDYWLSLERPGALAIQPIDISNLPVFAVEDYVQPQATNHTIGIKAATAALVAAGGGVLAFKPGKTYTVFTGAGNDTLINLTGANGVVIQGNGATLDSSQTNPAAGDTFIFASAVDGLRVENLTVIGGNETSRSDKGEYFLTFQGGSKNIVVENCEANFCLGGVNCQDTAYEQRNLVLLGCHFNKTFYPLVCYSVFNVFAQMVTRDPGRSLFLAAPGSNHEVWLDSQPGQMAIDCLLKVYAYDRKGAEFNTLKNIFLHYKSDGWTPGAAGSSAISGAVSIQLQQANTTSAAGHVRNIHVDFDVDGGGTTTMTYKTQTTNFAYGDKITGQTSGATATIIGDVDAGSTGTLTLTNVVGTFQANENIRVTVQGVTSTYAVVDTFTAVAGFFGDLFTIHKQNSSDAADTTGSRGYTVQNITVSGVARNWTSPQNGINLFPVASEWSGEQATGLAIRDFVINGAPAVDGIYVNGKPAVSGKPFLDIENVSIDGTYTEANCSTANIAHRNFAASNLSAADRRPVSWTPTGNGVTFANAVGMTWKDGRKVTAMFDVTWPNTADAGEARIGGLTFTVANNSIAQQGFISYTDVGAGTDYTLASIANTTYGRLFDTAGGTITNANMSQKRLIGTLVYFV